MKPVGGGLPRLPGPGYNGSAWQGIASEPRAPSGKGATVEEG
jgi:hypothetical protein